MATAPIITVSIGENGTTYFSATHRGVEYTCFENTAGWYVATHRTALGRHHIGGGKYYASKAEVAQKVKALAALDLY